MADCIFCKIINGEIPATKVFEDDLVFAFLDIQPINPGHTLVIPKKHAGSLDELDEDLAGHLMKAAKKIASSIRKSGLKCEGVNLHVADGAVAGQEVPHVHLHVIPRFAGDGFGLKFGPGFGKSPSPEEMADVAESIRKGLVD